MKDKQCERNIFGCGSKKVILSHDEKDLKVTIVKDSLGQISDNGRNLGYPCHNVTAAMTHIC